MKQSNKTIRALLSALLILSLATPALAQEPAGGETAPPEIPSWIDGLKVLGLERIRPMLQSNYEFDPTPDDNRARVDSKVQLGVQKDFGDDVTVKIVIQDARIWGGQPGSDTGLNTANSFTGESTDIREAYIHVKDLAGPVDLIAGRQILSYGSMRLIGHLDWTNVGRSFDGFRLAYDSKYLSSHAWATVLAESDNGLVGNNTAVGSGNSSGFNTSCDSDTGVCTITASTVQELDDSYFTGWYNTIKFGEWVHTDLYYLGRHRKWTPAQNAVTFAPNASIATQDRRQDRDNLYTFGGRITNKTIKKGGRKQATIPFDFEFEYAYQTGETGVRVDPRWDIAEVTAPIDPSLFNATNNPCQGSFSNGGCRIYSEKQRYDSYAYAADAGFTIADFVRIGGESRANARFSDITDSTGAVTSTGVAFLKEHLFKEYDIVYKVKFKGVVWGFGYSRIHAGDAIGEIKGDRRNSPFSRQDNFDPTADFAYMMMTYKF